MCMEKEKCEVCFSDLQKKGNELFENMEKKHDSFMSKMETRHNILMGVQLFLLGLFSIAITSMWVELPKKADKEDSVKRTEFELIIEQGDEYNRNVFVQKPEIRQDTFTYNSNKKLVFKNGLRGSKVNF